MCVFSFLPPLHVFSHFLQVSTRSSCFVSMCILRCLSEGASNLHMAQEGMVTKTNMQLQFVVKFKSHFNIMEGNTHKMLPGRILLSYCSPQCVLKCVLKLPAWYYAKSHWLHLFDFSPSCIFKCVLKLSSQDDVKSHWLHLVDYSPLSVKCILKWPASEYAYSHWLHLDCVFQNVSSNCVGQGMQKNVGCNCFTFHCVYSNDSWNHSLCVI